MKVLDINDSVDFAKKSIVTVGNFDGVHRGHRVLIDDLVKRAKKENKRSVVITFDPHTREVLFPDLPSNLLTTFSEKKRLIELLDVDCLLRIPFNREFSEMLPQEFIEKILISKLNVSDWIMGEGHSIGKNRSGGRKFLHDAMSKYHINIFATSLMRVGTETVSSTQIRKHVIKGNVAEAVGMLGHPYLISANRIEGLKVGSRLGFPTLNFRRPPSQKVLPPSGVYAAELEFGTNVIQGALYFGECPTFSNRDVHLEFHAFNMGDHEPEIGSEVGIWAYKFIRADKPFSGELQLVDQIKKDIIDIEKFFLEEKQTWR